MSHFIPKCGLICTSELKFASMFNKNDSKIGNFITKWQKLEEKSLKPISKCQKFLSKSQKLLSKCQKFLSKAKKLISKSQKLPITGISSRWTPVDFVQKKSLIRLLSPRFSICEAFIITKRQKLKSPKSKTHQAFF